MAGKILKILDIMRDGEEFYWKKLREFWHRFLWKSQGETGIQAKNVTAKAEEKSWI